MKLPDYNSLLKLESLIGLSQEKQLSIVGKLFDYSSSHSNLLGVEHAFTLSKQIDFNKLSLTNQVLYHYFLANGWSDLSRLKRKTYEETWNFQSEEIGKQIYHLRKAISLPGFKKIKTERKCQIYTNLGNLFNSIGRFVEAQEYWINVIESNPNFAMALGNKGYGLFTYSLKLFTKTHKYVFLAFSYHSLKKAIELKRHLEPGAESAFKKILEKIAPYIKEEFKNKLPRMNIVSLSAKSKLNYYRLWASQLRLFINPLNDLGNFTVSCHDCLNMPTITLPFHAPPTYILLFNQIKQEFASARYTFYRSSRQTRPHYSDKDVQLSDADDPTIFVYNSDNYSYNVEQLKVVFRTTYSILDKIAYLLNDYLHLNDSYSNTSFRKLWYKDINNKKLKPFFKNSDNWALRGLYWLSKDLYERSENHEDVIEPEAKEIASIRNFIEHKAFRVFNKMPPDGFNNNDSNFSYVITKKVFEQKTLKLLKLTRAAIMYLSIAINHEEKKKKKDISNTTNINMGIIPHSRKK